MWWVPGSMQAARKSGRPVGHRPQSWVQGAGGGDREAARGDGEKARNQAQNSTTKKALKTWQDSKTQGAVLDRHEVAPRS